MRVHRAFYELLPDEHAKHVLLLYTSPCTTLSTVYTRGIACTAVPGQFGSLTFPMTHHARAPKALLDCTHEGCCTHTDRRADGALLLVDGNRSDSGDVVAATEFQLLHTACFVRYHTPLHKFSTLSLPYDEANPKLKALHEHVLAPPFSVPSPIVLKSKIEL